MPIELLRARSRTQVAWLGANPHAEGKLALEEREYAVVRCTDEELQDPAFLAGLVAVVFTQNEKDLSQIVQDLKAHALRLLDYDCRIVIRSAPNGLSIIADTINELTLFTAGLPSRVATALRKWQDPTGDPDLPHARYFDPSVSWQSVANFITSSSPGPAPNPTLKIEFEPEETPSCSCGIGKHESQVGESPLAPEIELLLGRAFEDCESVYLEPLPGGRSGAAVYRAFARISGGAVGPWTQPHFVKIGKRNAILAEYKNYEARVDRYVPFYLGPRLDYKRCCLGGKHGVLIGDYVEGSESLRDCASAGRSTSAIACLFDRTLIGWYRQARESFIPFAAPLLHLFPREIDPARISRARQLGARHSIGELQSLFARCISTPVLVGRAHGDLNVTNVLVRATDAVVIDFASIQDVYPLLCDAAALEASLLVDGLFKNDINAQAWFESLRPAYDCSPLECKPLHVDPQSGSSWFYACVEQIRRYARQWECAPKQYAAALAFALLIKAKKDPNATEPEASRRAAAYALAELLLLRTFGPASTVTKAS